MAEDPPTKMAEMPNCSNLGTKSEPEAKVSESIRAKHKVPYFLISDDI
jgi:hypothetical protein